MTVKAIYENGVFKPREPVHLEENTEVEVLIMVPSPLDADDPTGWKGAVAPYRLHLRMRLPTWPSTTTTIFTASRRCDVPRHSDFPSRSSPRETPIIHSFVDCLSFVVMEKFAIQEALAVDSDFTHRFIARPGPMGR